jgi:hypothetical protein
VETVSYQTPFGEALHAVEVLRKYGILPTDNHFHVGPNGVKCEFCGKPVYAKIHDPNRMGRGE